MNLRSQPKLNPRGHDAVSQYNECTRAASPNLGRELAAEARCGQRRIHKLVRNEFEQSLHPEWVLNFVDRRTIECFCHKGNSTPERSCSWHT